MEQYFNDEVLIKVRRKKSKRIWRRIVSVLACLIVFCTTYMLILPAITKEVETFCGIQAHEHNEKCYETMLLCEGHTHTEDCYQADVELICTTPEGDGHTHSEDCGPVIEELSGCGLAEMPAHQHAETCYQENQQQTCPLDITPDHEHTESCYAQALICQESVHLHDAACFSDPSADLESAAQWTARLPQLTGIYRQDVLAIAASQLGYSESIRNYQVAEDGSLKGYTRYGDWYGYPYGDWCAMFVSFCLHYAEVEGMPLNSGCPDWVMQLQAQDLYRIPSEYVPKPGDLVFFDWEQDGSVDHVGLIETLVDIDATVIEGNSNNRVVRNTYELFDKCIAGYGMLIEPQPPVTENSDEKDTQSETTIGPEDTDAWAELVDPNAPAADAPQTEAPDASQESEAIVRRTADRLASPYSMGRTSSTFAARAGSPLDLTPYIKAVTMYDSDANQIPSGAIVTEGDLIEFRIDYTIDGQKLAELNGETVNVISDTLSYKIPSTFQVVRDSSGKIYNAQKQEVGSFVIDSSTGTITIAFGEEYVEQNANGMAITGKVSFYSTVVKVTDQDGEEQDFQFTDQIILGITIEEKHEAEGDLSIEKQKVSVNGEEIIYEVKVTSAEGTNGSVTITDTMSEGLTFQAGIEVLRGNGTRVNNARFNVAADKRSFTMTLPEMAAGDSYTIRYRCAADIDLLDESMTVSNTASVSGKDSQNNTLKDEVTVTHTFEMLKKTGVANDDGTITWTITVNQAKADISGWILEDIIITKEGNTAYTGTVTIRDINGRVLRENVKMPYTFPAGSNDTYVITYTTSHTLADGSMIYNRAILKDKDTEITVLTGTGVGSPIQKTGEAGTLFQDENGTYLLPITWTVTIDTTNGAIPGGEYLYDKMDGDFANDMYMTYEQLMAALENIEAEIIRAGSNEAAWFEAAVYKPGTGHGELYDILELWGNVNNCQSFLYERFAVSLDQPIPKNRILTFTYETYGVFAENIITTSVYKNRFNISEHYEVEGSVDFTMGTVKATKFALNYYDPNSSANQDWNMDWNAVEGISRFEYDKLHDAYLAWAIELSVPPDFAGGGDIVIYEDLPEGVSVKGLDLPFLSDVPTSRLRMRDMVPGQTYTWDFTVYPADQYNVWEPHRTGGQEVSIVIQYTEAGDLEITIPGIVFETMARVAVMNQRVEWYGYLYIYTQINEDFAWTPTAEGSYVYFNAFENRFTIKNEGGDVIDIGSQTQEITRDESNDIVRKEATVEDGVVKYSVVLNGYGRDLIQNSGTIHVVDDLNYISTADRSLRLRLVAGTVKLYEASRASDGNYIKGKQLDLSYIYNESSTESRGVTTWTHTLEMNVPDSKALILEYAYGATGDKDAVHEVHNVCSITGAGQGSLDGEHDVELEVTDSVAQADINGVVIYKVDANNNGLYLENAKFNIYIWNEAQNRYILVHHPNNGDAVFTTNKQGMIALDSQTVNEDQFAYNTAYYLVEIESPEGYYLGPEPYYFYIINEDTSRYPYCLPDNFQGHALVNGDVIYRDNVSDTTQISVEKYWKNYGGKYITVTGEQVPSITIELWQRLQNDPDSAKLYGTYTMTPDEKGNWNLTITDLPKATPNADGTKGTNYLYYIKEVRAGGYALESSENNSGINSGTIKLVNREQEGYVLPETGGAGTHMYTMAGLLLMLASAAYLVYIFTHRRREAQRSS